MRTPRLGLALVAVLALGAVGGGVGVAAKLEDDAATSGDDSGRTAELVAARRARAQVEAKLAARETNLRTRVRALYKLSRAGLAPLWVDEEAREVLVRLLAAARRLLLRDLEETKLLRDEQRRLAAAEGHLVDLAARVAGGEALVTGRARLGSLGRPVPGPILQPFGVALDPATRARVSNRGVVFATRRGSAVRAPHAGLVAYAGPIRGLGRGVLLGRDDGLMTVVGGLDDARFTSGGRVAAGAVLGAAAGDHIVLEVRAAGRPVDPGPLLRAR